MRKKLGFSFLCIIILSVITCVWLNSQEFKQQTAKFIAQQAQQVLGTKINIDSLYIVSLNSAAIDDVEIYDKQNELIASADKVVVKVNYWDLLRRSPMAGLSEIEVINPEANLVQREDKTWNIEDLIDKNSTTPVDFKGNVKVDNGQVTVHFDGKQITVDKMNLTADCADLSAIHLSGTLQQNQSSIEVNGTIGERLKTNLEVKAQDLNVLDYIAFIPQEYLSDVNIMEGHVTKADITIRGGIKNDYSLDGSVNFKDGVCEAFGQKIEDIKGLILLDNDDLQLFVKGTSKGQEVAVHGKINDYMTNPDLRLIAESKSFDPSLFIDGVPFSGNVAFVGAVYGTMDKLKIGAQVTADSANVYDYPISKLNIQARYADNKVFVDDLRADFANGWIWASGQCDLADLSYKGSFRAANIDISMFNKLVPSLKGTAMIRGDFNGQGLAFEDLSASGRIQIDNAEYENIPIHKLEASFYKEQNSIQIDAMTAEFANGGRLAAKGGINKDRLDIDFYASDVDLSLTQLFVPDLQISGNANFSGRLFGNIDNPVLKIDLMAKDGSIMQQPFDSVLVNAIGNLDGMRVDRCQFINNGEVTHEATGLLGFKGKQFIDMTVVTKKARMENLIKAIMPDFQIIGNIDNTLHLTGNLQDIKATGNMHFYEGSINGILISQIDGNYDYVDGAVTLNDFKITSPFIKASLNGVIDKEQNMNFKFKADEILVDKLQFDLPYPVSGTASFDGTLSGKIGALNFDGILKSDNITLNGQEANNIYGHVTLANRILKLEEFRFEQNGGVYTFNGSTNLNTKEVDGSAQIVQADINAAMAMSNLKNDLLTGRFDGLINISGSYENPHVDLKGSLPTGTLKDYPLQNIQIDAQLDNHVIKINNFYGEQGAGKVAAQGSVDLANGPIDGRISASNMDVNLLTHLCDMNININGVMNGDIQVGGTINSPTADISITTQGDGNQFDTAYLLANLKDDVIYINQMVATKGQCAIKSEGSIPIAALESDKRTSDNINQQMNLKVYLENTDLNILPSLTPYVDWATGNVQGNLNITGTVKNPKFQGSLSTSDSAIKFKYVDSPIQNMNVDIAFDNDLMTIKQFTGKVGKGDYTLTGSTHINGAGFSDYKFDLALNKLDIVSNYYTGPLNGNIQLVETDEYGRLMPKLITNINFNDIEVSMPPLPETSDAPLPDMALDINVALGDNVHAYDPLLYDLYLEGAFNIKGTTLHPKSSGSLKVNRGSINVLKTIFKIDVGNIVFNQVDSFFPSIDFLAMTRLDRTKVFVSLQGPLDKDLTPKLYSEPAMNDAEIIKLLAFRTDYKQGNTGEITEDDLLSLATVGLQMSFLNEVEGTLRNVLNLDEFRISRDTLSDTAKKRFEAEDNEVYNIQIGKYLSDKVMLRYTKGINYDLDRIGLQYYMNDNLGIITEYEGKGVYNLKLEMEWKF